MALKSNQTVSIGEASRITTASIKQIRHWEYLGLIRPERIICGQRSYRQYSDQELETIGKTKKMLNEGYTLKAAFLKVVGD